MEHYECSPPHQKSEDGQSSSWNSGSSAGATLEGMDVNRIMEDNIPLSYLYSPNIQGLLWDPSSLSHAVVPPLSSGDQRNEKREAPHPSAPHYDFGISVVPHEEEDYSSDEEVVYSDEGDLQPTERGNVKCRTL